MRRIVFVVVAAAVLTAAAVIGVPADQKAASAPSKAIEVAKKTLQTQEQKVSYSLGLDIGRSLRQQGVETDMAVFVEGLKDGMSGAEPRISEEEMTRVLVAFQQELAAKLERENTKAAGGNMERATAFLAENAKNEGVTTLPSGLQYEVLEPGKGPKPTAADKVTVNYRGTLMDGKEFDSSYKRGKPASFPVGGVISGWQEALKLMQAGAKWRLFIPPDLAYGERGVPPVIPPNSMLIFEVELLSIGD